MKTKLILRPWVYTAIFDIIVFILVIVIVYLTLSKIERIEKKEQELKCYEIEYKSEIYNICEK
ncbi:MAG: hypothetical protein RR478_04375 [Bacilli bacterium]